ncbi:MAG: metallopeptidase TldD-related protein [Fulvivirga sp.]|nr:metallopeptidase TldD-related protein [Fulvivirga sp.]
MYKQKSIVLITLLLTTGIFALAQQTDSVKLALKDELTRSMKELKLENHEPPFYISYGLNDMEYTTIAATLGALMQSDVRPNRTKNVRVMVGDYEFNDESLDARYYQADYNPGDWMVPLNNDYWTIRASYWETTDNIYKNAAKIYKEHIQYLEDKDKAIDSIPHRRFAKTEKVVYSADLTLPEMDLEKLEDKVRQASAYFLDYKEIEASGVIFNNNKTKSYFINSEGSDIFQKRNITSLTITARTTTEDGYPVFDYKTMIASTPEELPGLDSIQKEISSLVNHLEKIKTTPSFEDSYEGPVLFLDNAVPFLFGQIVGQFTTSDIPDQDGNDFNYSPVRSLDEKMGDRIISKYLSIRLTPKLTSYNGQPLYGAYKFDSEGVTPADEIVLVANGEVKNVMTSRTLTKAHHIANGTADGPGVIHVDYHGENETLASLKSKLLELVDEDGLEYGIIIKSVKNRQMVNVYKLYPDGTEEFFRTARIGNINNNTLRKVAGAMKSKKVHTIYGNMAAGINASFIVPEGILLKNVEVQANRMGNKSEDPLVNNPVN